MEFQRDAREKPDLPSICEYECECDRHHHRHRFTSTFNIESNDHKKCFSVIFASRITNSFHLNKINHLCAQFFVCSICHI